MQSLVSFATNLFAIIGPARGQRNDFFAIDLVETTLGPSGGYRLASAPAEVSFLDIVEAVEGKSSTFACSEIRYNNPCVPKSHRGGQACGIARVMWKADQAWRDVLRGVTLADLLVTLDRDIPPEIRRDTAAWLLERI